MCVYIKLQQEISPISLFDANIGTETTAVIDRATAKPAEARTIYAKEYVDGNRYLAAASYDRAFNKYYEAGKKGMSFSDIKRSSRDIKADSARRIYEAGRRAAENESKRQSKYKQTAEYKSRSEARTEANAKAKKKGGVIRSYAVDKKINRLQRQQLRVLDEWARQKGVTVQVAASLSEKIKLEGKVVNGRYDGGNVITIALDGKNMLTSTAGHELYHMIENLAPEYAKNFRSFVIDHLKEAGEYDSVFGDYERRYKSIYKADESFKAKIEEEIVADHCFEAMTNKEQWEKFAGEHKSIAEKIIDFIREFVAMISKAFDKYFVHDNAYIRDSVIGEVEYMNKIADMLWEGVDEAVENYRFGAGTESETRFKLVDKTADGIEVYETSQDVLNMTAKERKKAYLDLMRNEYAGRTARFVRNGHTYYAEFDRKNYSKPIYGEKHNSKRGLAALIRSGADGDVFDLVENSRYADSSADTKNHKAKDGFTDYFDYFVKTVQIDGRVYDLTATVKKQYGEKNGFTYSLFLKDNKKIKAAPTKDIKYIPQRSAQPSSDTTVSQGNGNVNTHSMQNSKNNSSFSASDSNGNQLSENQQKYFADSKVRDENGNLKVMYRGGNNTDTVFRRENTHGSNLYGRGFYFTDSESHAKQYGTATEYYLKIDNPLSTEDHKITKAQLRNFIDTVANDEEYGIDNYGQGATVDSVLNSVWGKDDFSMIQDINATAIGDMVEATKIFNAVNGTNYDGFILDTETVIFSSDQAKLTDNQNPTDNPDVRYSISKKFYDDFDKWDGKDTNTTFEIGNTSKALQSIGIKDQQFIMRSGMVRQKLNKHSELTRSTFRNIPELLEHPIIVQFSDAIDPKTGKAKYDSRITLLGELYAEMTVDGKKQKTPVLVSVELLPKSKGKTEISDFSVITSAYGHSRLQHYLNENSILYIDPNKKRTNKWLSLNRLQLPLGENRLGSVRRITYTDGKVKIENSKNFSPMQAALEKAGVVNSSGISLLNNSENDTDFSEKILSDDQRASVSDAGMRLTDNAELSSLMRDNADYKAEIEQLKGEFVKSKRMGGKGKNRLVQADIKRIARSIIGEYSSEISFYDLKDMLTGFYEFLANADVESSGDYAFIVKTANDIAKSVIAQSFTDITPEEFANYKKALRSYRLIPNLQDVAELKDMFGTFGAAYRQYGKKLNMRAKGTENAFYIDEVWEDLCEAVPLLDRNVDSTQEMWRNLIEVRDSLDEKTGFNPYLEDGELSAGQAAAALGADILERFNEVRADTTFADRAQQRVDLRFPIVVMRVKIFSLTSCSDIINPSLNRTLSRNSLTDRPHTLSFHTILSSANKCTDSSV